jgi:hypothetical protein
MTLIATLCVAFLIYLIVIVLLFQRVNRMIGVTVRMGSSPHADPLVRVQDGNVSFLGHSAPLIAVIGTTSIPPLWWLASTMYAANLRRTRERLGQCVECGEPLRKKRGRCPRCGERYERFVHRPPPTPVEFQRTMSRYVVRRR